MSRGPHHIPIPEEEPHTGAWCQECARPLLLGSQPGAWGLHGRAGLLLGGGVLTADTAHHPPLHSAIQALCPA